MHHTSSYMRDGQAMIFIAISLGGILLALTAVVGLLTFLQIRQAGDVAEANMADYAADAAFNYGTYLFVWSPEITAGTKTPVSPTSSNALLTQVAAHTFRYTGANDDVSFKFGCKTYGGDPSVPPVNVECTDSNSNLLIAVGKTISQSRTILRTLHIAP